MWVKSELGFNQPPTSCNVSAIGVIAIANLGFFKHCHNYSLGRKLGLPTGRGIFLNLSSSLRVIAQFLPNRRAWISPSRQYFRTIESEMPRYSAASVELNISGMLVATGILLRYHIRSHWDK